MIDMPEKITIRIISAPVFLADGYYLDSPYVDQFWCPVIGPSCVMLLKAIDRMDHAGCRTSTVSVEDLAQELGLSVKKGRNSMMWRTIDRLVRFRLAALSEDRSVLEVRDRVPMVSRRLPKLVHDAHREFLSGLVAA